MLSNQRLDVFFRDDFYYVHNKTSNSLSAILYQVDDPLFNYPLEIMMIDSGEEVKLSLDYKLSPSFYLFVEGHIVSLVNPILINSIKKNILFNLVCECKKKTKDISKCKKCKDQEQTLCNKHNFIQNIYRFFLTITQFDTAFNDYQKKLNNFMLEVIDDQYHDVLLAIGEQEINGEYCQLYKYHKLEMMFFYKYIERIYRNDFDFDMDNFNLCARGTELDVELYDEVLQPVDRRCLSVYSSITDADGDIDLSFGSKYILDTQLDGIDSPVYVKIGFRQSGASLNLYTFPQYNGIIPLHDTVLDAESDVSLDVGEEWILTGNQGGTKGELFVKMVQSNGTVEHICADIYSNHNDVINDPEIKICDQWILDVNPDLEKGKVYLKTTKII